MVCRLVQHPSVSTLQRHRHIFHEPTEELRRGHRVGDVVQHGRMLDTTQVAHELRVHAAVGVQQQGRESAVLSRSQVLVLGDLSSRTGVQNRKATLHRRDGLGRVNTGAIRVSDLDVRHARVVSKVADAVRAQTQLEVLIGRGNLHGGLNTRFLSGSVDHAYYTVVSVRDGTAAELDAGEAMSLAERTFQRSTTGTHYLVVDRGQTKAQAIGVSEMVGRNEGARPVEVGEYSEPSRGAITGESCESDLKLDHADRATSRGSQ
jgi:hypothetical protein